MRKRSQHPHDALLVQILRLALQPFTHSPQLSTYFGISAKQYSTSLFTMTIA